MNRISKTERRGGRMPRKTLINTFRTKPKRKRSLLGIMWRILSMFLVAEVLYLFLTKTKRENEFLKTQNGMLVPSLSQGADASLRGGSKTLNSNLVPARIKSRYVSLPSPPWPQLDHRIPRAVLDGDLIGFDPSKPMTETHNNTIVTAYYEFTSKHSPREYERWFERILLASEPMIIFLEPGSRWVDFVAKKRTHAPTILAQISFDECVMSTTFTKDFWNFMFSIDTEAKVHKANNVYKVWNEKLIYMYAATMLNPFDTPGFAWMDAGYFRQITPDFGEPIIKVNITEDGIAENELVVLHVRDDPISAIARVNVAGNAFLGTRDGFLKFYPKYYETFWDWISIKKFIGSDQFVMTETCRRYRSHCHPFFPGHFKQWFAMWTMMQGNIKDYASVSKKYIFEDEAPSSKEVPNGKRVTYCKGQIVTFESDEPVC